MASMGSRLRALRMSRGLTIKELALAVGRKPTEIEIAEERAFCGDDDLVIDMTLYLDGSLDFIHHGTLFGNVQAPMLRGSSQPLQDGELDLPSDALHRQRTASQTLPRKSS